MVAALVVPGPSTLTHMASGVTVRVTDRTVITALNTPGGPLREWREELLRALQHEFDLTAPEGDPRNRTHDRKVGGNYMKSQYFRRSGNGHSVGVVYGNNAFYAEAVEFGRSPTGGYEKFAWRKHTPPGSIKLHKTGTGGYAGMHVQRDIANVVMPRFMDGYAPLD